MVSKKESVCASCGSPNGNTFLYCQACGEYLKKNYFDVLEVNQDAGIREIRKAYLKASAKCHPDKTENLADGLKNMAAAKMLQLNLIWEILKNSESRAEYIESLQRQAETEKASEIANLGKKFWRRIVARLIDYLLLSFFFSVPARYIARLLLEKGELSLGLPPVLLWVLLFIVIFVLGVALTFLWVFVEAGLLHKLTTTPGKWLMQLNVTAEDGEPLSLANALQRSRMVWIQGIGCGLLPLVPVLVFVHYRQAQAQYDPPWDVAISSQLVYKEMPQFAVVASAVILLQAAVLIYIDFHQFSIDNLPALSEQQAPTNSEVPAMATTQQPPVSEPVTIVQPTPPSAETIATTDPTPPPTAVANTPELPAANDSAATTVKSTPSRQEAIPTREKQPPARTTISYKQHTECMQQYFASMNAAKDIPLGDYARVLRQANIDRDRCLGKL